MASFKRLEAQQSEHEAIERDDEPYYLRSERERWRSQSTVLANDDEDVHVEREDDECLNLAQKSRGGESSETGDDDDSTGN